MPIYRRYGLGQSMVHVLGLDFQLPRFLASAVAGLIDDDFFVDIETSDDERRDCTAELAGWHPKPSRRGILRAVEFIGDVSDFELEVGGLVQPGGRCIHVHNLKDSMKVEKQDKTSVTAFGFSISLDFDWKITFSALQPRSINDVLCEEGMPCPQEEEEWLMSLNALHEGSSRIEISGPGFRFSDTKRVSQTDELKFRVTPHTITPLPRGATEASGILRMPSRPVAAAGTSTQTGITERSPDCAVEIIAALVDGAVNPDPYRNGQIQLKLEARLTGPTGEVDDVEQESTGSIDADGVPRVGVALSGTAKKACDDIYWANIKLTVKLFDENGNDLGDDPLERVTGGEFCCPEPNPDPEKHIVVQLVGTNAQLYFRIRLSSECARKGQ